MKKRELLTAILAALSISGVALAADNTGQPGGSTGKRNPLKNVYFGEQHMHTQNSFDAYTVGARGTWSEAYEFALGKPSKQSSTGENKLAQAA